MGNKNKLFFGANSDGANSELACPYGLPGREHRQERDSDPGNRRVNLKSEYALWL